MCRTAHMPRRIPRLTGWSACLSWLALQCLYLPALFGQYQFDCWTVDNGLPQNIIRDIRQTRDGYLWLATLDGLARFDGVRFTVFDRSHFPGIGSNRFYSLYEDSHGDLWLGTENGGVTRYHEGVFTTYTTEHGLPRSMIRGVTGDEAGNIWVLSDEQIMSWDNGRFRPTDLPGPHLSFYASDWDPQIFWAIDDITVYRFAHGRLTTRRLPPQLRGLSNNRFEEDPSGTLWMATDDGRIASIKDGKLLKIQRIFEQGRGPRLSQDLQTIYLDRRGNQWPMVLGANLVRFWIPPSSASQTEPVAIRILHEDHEGNLWLGTDGRGLYRVRRQAIKTYSQQHGLIGRNVYPIYQDHTGAIWIGTWNGGLSRFQDGKFTNYTPSHGLASGLVMAIAEDRKGRLWVATRNSSDGGLRILQNGRFTRHPDLIMPADSPVAVIHHDQTAVTWIGTARGLVRYQDGASKVYTVKDGLASDDVRVIIEDSPGCLWIGGYGGLSRFQQGKFTGWTERDGLPSNSVRALYSDGEGVLWIGTYDGGLGRLQGGKFTRYTIREGLFNNGVFQILEDERGNLWMSCNRGLHRVSKHELNEFAQRRRQSVSSVSFGKSDGLLNAECNGGLWPAGIRARDGKLWFPTQDGVAVVDPETMKTSTEAVPAIIEAVLIDRQPVTFDSLVRVHAGQENFEIQYTGLSLINSDRLKFRYRLQGLDRDWTEAATRRTAYYSHVPAGEYTFTVTAANQDGIWNVKGASLHLVVLPPFYRTWWFTLLLFIGIGGSFGLAWQIRISHLQRAQAAQQAFARQLIASQEGERKRIAAELHDSLGQHLVVIKNLALLSLSGSVNNGAGRQQMEDISAEASQAIAEVKEISYNLRPYQLDRIGLTKALEAVVKRAGAASGIKFSSAIDDIDHCFPKESEINFYRIVQEGVNNIIKHSAATEAWLTVRREDHCILLTVTDNGRGFAAVSQSSEPGGGFGLIGITERAQLLGGKAAIQSAPGEGTTMTVTIQLRTNSNG